jgi:hypothetical protein
MTTPLNESVVTPPVIGPVITYGCMYCTTCSKTSTMQCVPKAQTSTTVVVSNDITDNTVCSTITVNPWKPGVIYKANDQVLYNNKKYVCLQLHTSNMAWTPNIILIMWKPL